VCEDHELNGRKGNALLRRRTQCINIIYVTHRMPALRIHLECILSEVKIQRMWRSSVIRVDEREPVRHPSLHSRTHKAQSVHPIHALLALLSPGLTPLSFTEPMSKTKTHRVGSLSPIRVKHSAARVL